MRTILILLVLMLAIPSVAQTNCGNGLPCGPVPWTLPSFPNLQSPTPANYTNSQNVVFVTATPGPTSTQYITPTQFFDTSAIQDNVSTIEALFNATNVPITNGLGTPIAIDATIATNGTTFFSYARGFSANSFGVFAPLVDFILFAFLLSLAFALTRIALPLLAVLLGIIRKVVQLILDFIPL
jgi:hypothetical protein